MATFDGVGGFAFIPDFYGVTDYPKYFDYPAYTGLTKLQTSLSGLSYDVVENLLNYDSHIVLEDIPVNYGVVIYSSGEWICHLHKERKHKFIYTVDNISYVVVLSQCFVDGINYSPYLNYDDIFENFFLKLESFKKSTNCCLKALCNPNEYEYIGA